MPTRGQIIVGALAVTEVTSWGVMYYGFGTMLPSMRDELGWSKVTFTGGFSLAIAVSAICGIAVGRYLDRHSPRMLMTFGSALATAMVFAWSAVHSPWSFYAVWTGLGVAMACTLYEPAFVVLTKWTSGAHRRKALTAVTLVAGLASTIFVPLEERLIEHFGWRGALRVLAVVLGLITVPLHGLVLRNPGHAERPIATVDSPTSTRSATRTSAFWWLCGSVMFLGLSFSALIAHQVALFIERGWTPRAAATAIAVIGLWQLGGRLAFAPLAKYLPAAALAPAIYLFQVVALAVAALSDRLGPTLVYVAFTGIARGMTTLVRATLIADLWGAENYGSIAGLVAFAATGSTAIGPLLGGVLWSERRGYGPMLWVLLGLAVIATAMAAGIQPRQRPQQRSSGAVWALREGDSRDGPLAP